MKTISEIEKDVKRMRKQYHEGYSDIMEYMSKFGEGELDYIEITEKVEIQSYKRLGKYKDMLPLVISMLALLFASLPEIVKADIVYLETTEIMFIIVVILVFGLYLLFENVASKNLDIKYYILEVIEKVRKK